MSTPPQIALASGASDSQSSGQSIRTAAKGGGILFAGQLFEYASRFIFGIVVARSLGADGYGLYDLAITTALILSTLATVGLTLGIVRFLPPAIRKQDTAQMWNILLASAVITGFFGLALGLAVFGLANPLAENLFHKPNFAPMLRIAAVAIPLIALNKIIMAAIRAFKEMQYQVFAESVLLNVSRISLAVLFLSAGLGAAGVLAAYVLGWVAAAVLLLFFLNRLFALRPPAQVTWRYTRELLSFSLPLWLTIIVIQFSNQLEVLLLGILGTTTAVGVYGAALRIQMVGSMLLRAVQEAARPIISDLHERRESKQLSQLYRTLTKWAMSFNIPFFLTTILFGRPLLRIFGEDFAAGEMVLIIMALSTVVNASTGICTAMIDMTGHSRLRLINSVGALVLNVILDILLIRAWGMIGAAAAASLVIVIMSGVSVAQVYWLLRLVPYDPTFFKPIAAGFAAFVVGLIANYLAPADRNPFNLMLDIAVLWSSYAAMTLLLGISEEDRMILGRFKRRFSSKRSKHGPTIPS